VPSYGFGAVVQPAGTRWPRINKSKRNRWKGRVMLFCQQIQDGRGQISPHGNGWEGGVTIALPADTGWPKILREIVGRVGDGCAISRYWIAKTNRNTEKW